MGATDEAQPMANEAAVLEQAARWLESGEGCAIATVTETWGSSPRPVGSQLAVAVDGRFVGSVSGGCVEGAVVGAAKQAIVEGAPRQIEFGVTDAEAWAVGLACGGRVAIYVEPAGGPGLPAATLERLLEAYRSQKPVARMVDLANGTESLVEPDGAVVGAALPADAVAAAQRAIAGDRSELVPGTRLFARAHNPPTRLLIVGATHIAQFLAPMARIAGYRVVIVDPRRAFATAKRFPGFTLSTEWPSEAFARLKPDGRTAIVTLAHDPKVDDIALKLALASPVFYVGALGSRKNQALRLERLKAEGLSDEALSRLHGPVGLDIGARSPAEIAISILAEITQARRLAPGR